MRSADKKDIKILEIVRINLSTIIWAVVGFFLFRWVTKGNGIETITNTVKGATQTTEDAMQALSSEFGVVADSRKAELDSVANEVYDAMEGIGADKNAFIRSMIKVNDDNEFQYMEKSFGIRKRKNLREWIKKEILIGSKVKEQVNMDYASKSMSTTI